MTEIALGLLIACIPIIFGSKWFFTDYGMVQHPCPKCGNKPTMLRYGRQRAHVYHIPLFKTKESHAVRCEPCDSDWIVDEHTGLKLRLEALQNAPAVAPTATPVAAKQIREAAPAGVRPASCAKCGSPLAAGAKFCVACGTPVTQSDSCPACGAPRGSGKFCGHCGAELPAPAAASPAAEGDETPRRPPPPPPPRKDLAES